MHDMNSPRGWWTGSVAVVGAAALALAATAQVDDPMFTLEDLGTLGGRDSVPLAMNDAEQIVGWSHARGPGGPRHAFLWEDGVMRDLGAMGGVWSEARAINDAGMIVGAYETADGSRHAFYAYDGRMWDLNDLIPRFEGDPAEPNPGIGFDRFFDKTGSVTLGQRPPDAPGGGPACMAPLRTVIEANAVSEEGVIAVCASVWTDDAAYGFALLPVEPFHPGRPRFCAVNLGVLPEALDCFPSGVNGSRQVVGHSGGRPFIWRDGVIELIEDVDDPEESLRGAAVALNDLEVAAGHTGDGWYLGPKACIWRNGRRYDLSAEGPGTISMALDLNECNQVVGWEVIWDSLPSAVLWDCAGETYDLNHVTALPASPDRHGFAWSRLAEATAIDERGRIAGLGEGYDGRQRAFLLRPISPGGPTN